MTIEFPMVTVLLFFATLLIAHDFYVALVVGVAGSFVLTRLRRPLFRVGEFVLEVLEAFGF